MEIETLTKRENEVLDKVAEGWTNKEIARYLSLTEGAIKKHVSNILQKKNLKNRTQIVIYSINKVLQKKLN